MKKKLVITAMILAMIFAGCGNSAAQTAQETTAPIAESKAEEASEEAGEVSEEAEEVSEEASETDNQSAEKKDEPESDMSVDGETEDSTTEDKETKDKAVKGKDTKNKDTKEEDNKTEDAEAEDADAEDAEAKEEEAEETPALPEYTVSTFEESKVMFASNPVNVRKGPTTDFERVGGLNRGQEVTVTGQADTKWYEILYGEEKAYVSNNYLQDEKPAEPAPQPAAEAGVQAVTEVKNVAGVILVGDSRFVQMQENVGPNSCTWIAENAKGYKWLSETAMPRIDGCVGKGSKILINLGVNDPENARNYAELINAKAAEWVNKGAKVYYASINPVWENPYTTKEEVEAINSYLQSNLSANVHWIDSYSYLNSIGYKLVDGLHYSAETYQNIYAYYMSCL